MKFTYDKKEDSRECVAYTDRQGDLVLKVGKTHADGIEAVCIDDGGFFHFNLIFEPSEATHKFYPGDKVKIEF